MCKILQGIPSQKKAVPVCMCCTHQMESNISVFYLLLLLLFYFLESAFVFSLNSFFVHSHVHVLMFLLVFLSEALLMSIAPVIHCTWCNFFLLCVKWSTVHTQTHLNYVFIFCRGLESKNKKNTVTTKKKLKSADSERALRTFDLSSDRDRWYSTVLMVLISAPKTTEIGELKIIYLCCLFLSPSPTHWPPIWLVLVQCGNKHKTPLLQKENWILPFILFSFFLKNKEVLGMQLIRSHSKSSTRKEIRQFLLFLFFIWF